MIKCLYAIFVIFLVANPLWAESRTKGELELFNSFYRGSDDYLYTVPAASTSLSFTSDDTNTIHGEIKIGVSQIDYQNPVEIALISLEKLFVKFSFGPQFIIGKTRQTWGFGAVFNSGDVIYGSLTPEIDLNNTDIRNETAWLTAVNIPLWSIGYIEGIFLPPNIGKRLNASSVGGRIGFYIPPLEMDIQAGYIYRGDNPFNPEATGHRSYIALRGSLAIDYYVSSSITLSDQGNPEWKAIRETWSFAPGVSYSFSFGAGYDQTLSFRLESAIIPWHPETGKRLCLAPEIVWTLPDSISFALRSLIAPLDPSANLSLAVSWNPYSTINLFLIPAISIGEVGKIFSFEETGGLSCAIGVRYSF